MSFELRLSQLQKSWIEIQDLRDKMKLLNSKKKKIDSEIRSIAQLIPKKLDEYNKIANIK